MAAKPRTNGEMMAKPRTLVGVTILARINLVIYVLLLFWALSSVFYAVNLVAMSLVLYSIAGVICSSGLLQHKRWSWYMAVAMWIVEGVASSWVTYSNIGLLSTDPETIIIFLSIAIFKFATAAYLAKRKVRESFNPQHVDAATSNNTLATKDFSVEDEEEKGCVHQWQTES